MAWADISTVVSSREGATPVAIQVPTAAIGRGNDSVDSGKTAFISGAGKQFVNDSRGVALLVENNSDAAAQVKIVTSKEVDGLPVDDRIVTIASGARAWIGPFTKDYYVDTYVDGDTDLAHHTNYIQVQFALDSANGTESITLGVIEFTAFVIARN